jgi:hypothetical protein
MYIYTTLNTNFLALLFGVWTWIFACACDIFCLFFSWLYVYMHVHMHTPDTYIHTYVQDFNRFLWKFEFLLCAWDLFSENTRVYGHKHMYVWMYICHYKHTHIGVCFSIDFLAICKILVQFTYMHMFMCVYACVAYMYIERIYIYIYIYIYSVYFTHLCICMCVNEWGQFMYHSSLYACVYLHCICIHENVYVHVRMASTCIHACT